MSDVEVRAKAKGIKGKLVLNFKIPISRLKPCQGQIQVVRKRIHAEKWYVHQDFDGNFTQRKVGEEENKI